MGMGRILSTRRQRGRVALAATAVLLGLGWVTSAPRAVAATPLTISGSMEGNLPVHPNDTLSAGFDFTMPGAHPAATVTVFNASLSLTVVCADNSTVPLAITFPTYTVTVPAGNSNWWPSGDQKSSLVYQGSTTVPATLCGGSAGHAPKGATFTAQFGSTDTFDPVHVRFHYADNTAGSWSGTASIVPGPPPPATVPFWVQSLDSCKKAEGGGTFQLSNAGGPIASVTTPAGQFSKWTESALQETTCPQQGGNCDPSVDTNIGCADFTLDIPTSGTAAYTVTETTAPSGYYPCEGGSACRSEVINVTVDSAGNIQATMTNVYPDGTVKTFPISDLHTGNPYYTGAQDDPAIFNSASAGTVPCNAGDDKASNNGGVAGDGDGDDLNGSDPGGHCDNG